MLTLPELLSSPPYFSGVCVTRSLVLCVCFVDRRLRFLRFYVFKGINSNSDAIPDPCDPGPCQNNGTCDGVSGKAACLCPPEYTGPTCEGNIYDDSEEKAS